MKRLLVLMMCAMLAVQSVGMNVQATEQIEENQKIDVQNNDENEETADQVAVKNAKVLNDYLRNKKYDKDELKQEIIDVIKPSNWC